MWFCPAVVRRRWAEWNSSPRVRKLWGRAVRITTHCRSRKGMEVPVLLYDPKVMPLDLGQKARAQDSKGGAPLGGRLWL